MSHNIFSALAHKRTAGVVREFVLWCVVCFTALLSLVAAVVGKGNITWIMLMIFSIGLGVIMVFRLTPVALLYSSGTFCLIVFVIHYICFSRASSYYGIFNVSYSPLNIILFVLLLFVSIALVDCEFVHFFSRYNLKKPIMILMITDAAMTWILQILMFAAGYLGNSSFAADGLRSSLNERGYWIGTISFWMILAVTVLLHVFFFYGMLDSEKRKTNGGSLKVKVPSIRGIKGRYAGQIFSLNSGMVTIGSGSGMSISIQDGYVSRQHCAVRFNYSTNFYEIYDNSSSGVFTSAGIRLQKDTYNAVKQGEVICIGSKEQQFQLL